MARFESVLYLERQTTVSRRALVRALDVARRHGARLTVAQMVDGSLVEPGASQRAERVLRSSRARVAELVAGGPLCVDTAFRVLSKESLTAVARIVRDGRYDLVMTPVAERTPLRRWSTGRLERALLHGCPCPVWFVDAAQTNPVGDVLVAVDVGQGHSPALNRRLLETATAVAGRAGSTVHVVHAWSLAGEAVLKSPVTGVGRSQFARMSGAEGRIRRQRVEELIEVIRPEVPTHVEVAKGDAAWVIREIAWKIEADLVLVGNSLRRGISGLVFGNLAERLIGCVPSSVLVLPEQAEARPTPVRRSTWDGGVGYEGTLEVRA